MRSLFHNMKGSDYITILAPMVSRLNLSGNNLIIFALIHGFSKDGEHEFTGSIEYICKWTNLSKPSVISSLKALTNAGLLNKTEKVVSGVKFCSYTTNYEEILANLTGSKESLPVVKKTTKGGKESLPNIDKDIDINNNSIKRATKFVKPSVEEIKEYCQSRLNNLDAQTFFDFYESKGWKIGSSPMKDWKAAVRTWERRNVNPYKSRPAVIKKSSFSSMRDLGEQLWSREKEVSVDEQ